LERGFPGLDLSNPADVYFPVSTAGDLIGGQNLFADPSRRTSPVSWITVLGRLRPGATNEVSAGQLTQVVADPRRRAVVLIPIQTAMIPEALRPGLEEFVRLLTITVALLLLVGCLTVGLLLVIRTEARRAEFATCLALGASRVALARGVLLEGALLVIVGSLLSLPVAAWYFHALSSAQLPGGVSVAALDLRLDVDIVLATGAVAGAVMLVLAPIVATFGVADGGVHSNRVRAPRLAGRRTRSVLVASQVAATVVLVAGAGLFMRSLSAALHVNPGFDTTRLLTSTVSLPAFRLPPERHHLATPFFDALRSRLNNSPAVQSASLFHQPVGMGGSLVIDGITRQFPTAVWVTSIDERYFSTIGLRPLRGRDFSSTDDDRAPLVTIISEAFGRMLSNGGNPIGSRVQAFHGKPGEPFPLIEVVGVVPDVITDVTRLQPLVMYVPLAQEGPDWSRQLVLRPRSSRTDAARETLAAIQAVDPTLTPPPTATPLLTVDELVLAGMAPQRLGLVVLGALGGVALFLTVLGTYVLAESMAVARTREMGVRAALGANERQVATIIVAETVRLVGAGLAAGLVLTWLARGIVRAFLFRVEPLDPLTLITVTGTILALSLIVTLRPALAVARVDLTQLMRHE
jgi:predicted permease